MTFESNYAIVIAIRSVIGSKNNLVPVFNQAKPKPIAPSQRDFFRALNKLQGIACNSDYFIALFSPVVIGRVITLVLIFR